MSKLQNTNPKDEKDEIESNLAKCPACETLFPLDSDFKENGWIECPECFTSLEIKSINPPIFFPVTNIGK